MITEDYVLRMIQDMSRMIASLLGLETESPYRPEQSRIVRFGDEPGLPERIRQLADSGEINQAENLLFEELDFSDPGKASVALEFYRHLNTFSDARLETCGYSREEILEGLRDCAARFGVDKSLLSGFLDERKR